MLYGTFVIILILLKLDEKDLYFLTVWNADIVQKHSWLDWSKFHFQFDTLILIGLEYVYMAP